MGKELVCCYCLSSQTINELEIFICVNCGKTIYIPRAIETTKFVRSLGEGIINNALAMRITNALPDEVMTSDSHIRLKSGKGIIFNIPSLIERAKFELSMLISEDTILQEGLCILKDLVEKTKKKLLRENGIEISTRQIIAILEATYTGKYLKGKPQFGFTVVQNLRSEFQDTEFFLYPKSISKHEACSDYPIMANHEDIAKGIREDSIEAFKKTYDCSSFGGIEARYKQLPNTVMNWFVLGIELKKSISILIIPGTKSAYIFIVQ